MRVYGTYCKVYGSTPCLWKSDLGILISQWSQWSNILLLTAQHRITIVY